METEKYNKQERNRVYKLALIQYNEQHSPYLCDCMNRALYFLGFTEHDKWQSINPNEFPEFMSYDNGKFAWWNESDKESRINCLNDCIDKTK